MTDHALTAADAQQMRHRWFRYLDMAAPIQQPLHAYSLKLTGNLWDAEDLVQDTLLRGFAMAARGDFHGEQSPVRNLQAYLFRTATNLWLDLQRRRRWQGPVEGSSEPSASDADPVATTQALERLAALTSAREFAAMLLKDVYGFTLEETADFIGTTTGTVKSALSRGRGKMKRPGDGAAPAIDPQTSALVRAFVDAMNARDVERILQLMAETVKVDVCNVGGGRGRDGLWTEKTLEGFRFEYGEHHGEPLLLLFGENDRTLQGVVRLQGDGHGLVTRIVDYHYAADTLQQVADALGLECVSRGYHQGADMLPDMLSTTGLPWRG